MIVLNQHPVNAVAQITAQSGAIAAHFKCGKVPYYSEVVVATGERYAIHTTIDAIEKHVKHCTDCWVRITERHQVLRPNDNDEE